MKRFFKSFFIFFTATLLTLSSAIISIPLVRAATLSANGQSGFTELSRCLNSNDVLDVYYMIDESSSLSSGAVPGAPGSDPNDDRAKILASSVESLQSLRPGLKVNVGLATFAVGASEQKSWIELTKESTAELAEWIRAEIPDLDQGGATNWEAALSFSQNQLANAPSIPGERCQALVWFTDGYLNVAGDPEFDNLNDRQAMGKLCSTDHIRGEEFLAPENSVVSALRASGVTILGIQLQDKNWNQQDLDYASLMRAIVEGEGSTGAYSTYKCGVMPIPATSRPGALLIAQNPFDLAFQFQSIGQQASGGVSVPLAGNPAPFLIEDGVSSFNVATTDSGWELTSPNGNKINAANAAESGFQVVEESGSFRVSRSVTSEDLGNWEIFIADTANQRAVYLFSGLGISVYNTDFFSGEKGSISGVVVRELDGKPVDLSVYSDANSMSLSLVSSNGSLLAPIDFPINSDGSFSLSEIDFPTDRPDVDLRLQLDLATKSGIQLAPISFAKKVPIAMRKDFPTVEFVSPLVMSNLKGKQPATGTLNLIGPESGSGQICIGSPQVRDTEVNRVWDSENTVWTVSEPAVTNGENSCVDLAQGESKSIQVSLANSQVAESFVSGEIPLLLVPADSTLGNRKVKVPFEFESTRAGEAKTVLAIEAILTILGILLPIVLLYLLTLWTTKFSVGNDLIRKQIPVEVSASGVKVRDGGESIKFTPVAPMADTRSFIDSSGIVNLQAKVSKLVFPAPWYEVQASPGSRVITFVSAPRSKATEFESGKTAAVGADVGKQSYFIVNEQELASSSGSDPINASLVIYSRLGRDENARVSEILLTPGTWDRFTALRENVSKENQSGNSGSQNSKTPKKNKSKDKVTNPIQQVSVAQPDQASPPSVPNLGGSVPPPPGLGGSVPPPGSTTTPGAPPPPSLPGLGGSVPPPPKI